MEECALTLQRERAVPSDTALHYYLRLLHLSEEIASAFNYGNARVDQSLSESKIKLCVSEFDRQIAKIRNDLTPEMALSS